jgi:hypothetical protein
LFPELQLQLQRHMEGVIVVEQDTTQRPAMMTGDIQHLQVLMVGIECIQYFMLIGTDFSTVSNNMLYLMEAPTVRLRKIETVAHSDI